MAIKFKVIERGEPGVVGGGTKKFYASPVMDGEMNLNDLTEAIEKICTVCLPPPNSRKSKLLIFLRRGFFSLRRKI